MVQRDYLQRLLQTITALKELIEEDRPVVSACEAIRRELRRRSAIEPVIGHMKNGGRLDRNYLKGRDGDRINAILVGAGHNFRLLLKWLRLLFALILGWMMPMIAGRQPGAATA